jgi:hypothetical protein
MDIETKPRHDKFESFNRKNEPQLPLGYAHIWQAISFFVRRIAVPVVSRAAEKLPRFARPTKMKIKKENSVTLSHLCAVHARFLSLFPEPSPI